MDKLFILLAIVACVIWFVVGIKTLTGRLFVLGVVVVSLAITVPNYQRPSPTVLQSHFVAQFTRELEALLREGRTQEAQEKLELFNQGFPGVAGNLEDLSEFLARVSSSTNRSE